MIERRFHERELERIRTEERRRYDDELIRIRNEEISRLSRSSGSSGHSRSNLNNNSENLTTQSVGPLDSDGFRVPHPVVMSVMGNSDRGNTMHQVSSCPPRH